MTHDERVAALCSRFSESGEQGVIDYLESRPFKEDWESNNRLLAYWSACMKGFLHPETFSTRANKRIDWAIYELEKDRDQMIPEDD